MFCTQCGKKFDEDGKFCQHCGKRLTPIEAAPEIADPAAHGKATEGSIENTETTLLTFGPFGVSVCDGPYSMFRWQRKNVTIIEVANVRIRGFPNHSLGFFRLRPIRRSSFEIPYSAVLSLEVYPHPAGLGLMRVLDIKYRQGGMIGEKSICSYSQNIEKAYQLIRPLVPAYNDGRAYPF